MLKEPQAPAEGIMKKRDFSWSSKWYTVDCDCGHGSAVMDLSCEHDKDHNYTELALTWWVDMAPKIDWSRKPWRLFFQRIGMGLKLMFGMKIEWQEDFVFTAQAARNIGTELLRAADEMDAHRKIWNDAVASGADRKQIREQLEKEYE